MRMKPGKAAVAPALLAASFIAALAVSLGGCSSTTFNAVRDPFVAPAKFQFLRCEDIAKRLVAAKTREQELRTLMDRSAAGTGGSTINLFVYQPEYQTVQSELQQLKQEAAEKQCPEPAKADAKAAEPKTAEPKTAEPRKPHS
jgi:hypothetical protein